MISSSTKLARWVAAVAAVSAGAACSGGAPPERLAAASGPRLASLGVTASGAGTTLELVPSFAPDVHDYYVRCPAAVNDLTVTATAATGSTSYLRSPRSTAPAPVQELELRVKENAAIVAVAADGQKTAEYWVRCLPYDFPAMQMTRRGTPIPGYYLLGNALPSNARWGYAMVVDGNGVPVWYAHGPPDSGVEDVDAVVPGAISFIPARGMLPIEIHYLDPPRTSYVRPLGTEINTHELRVLANGDYLVVSSPTKNGVDLTGLHVSLPDGTIEALGANASILDCEIVEFEPDTGKVVWRWVGSDHFDPAKDSAHPLVAPRVGPRGAEVIDTFHCNSIDFDAVTANVLVSARNMNSVFYVDRRTGDVLWKMGGYRNAADHAVYVPVDDPFEGQHDARLLGGWSPVCGRGRISLFDDQSFSRGPARALILEVDLGTGAARAGPCGAGTGVPSATVVWQYRGETPSGARGSFRISADGSHVIDWGNYGDALRRVFTEVDPDGTDLMDFYFTDGNVSYRVIKVPVDAFDLGVLRETAGLP